MSRETKHVTVPFALQIAGAGPRKACGPLPSLSPECR